MNETLVNGALITCGVVVCISLYNSITSAPFSLEKVGLVVLISIGAALVHCISI